jgi:hypothetical protein
MPRELVERAKTGFSIPLGEWLRGLLREWAEISLSDRPQTFGATYGAGLCHRQSDYEIATQMLLIINRRRADRQHATQRIHHLNVTPTSA